jgi:phosphoribosylformylglycinamidine synthase subunit PurSL
VFCVAFPDRWSEAGAQVGQSTVSLPPGTLHPRRILTDVVAGVRDYGNRMGIPTVNGAVYFDNRYVGNPLVFCGCAGIIPRDKIEKAAQSGDAVVVMGGRTGRDGIHGATFSSAELTDTHADEFSHAVQIGNPITEKKMADVILQARDRGLYTAITDCGAGGLSSAVGEMGEKIGARVDLEKVPLKYAGLRYDEIWISEAQERMVLSVPPQHVEELLNLAASEDVEATVIGTFGTERQELVLYYESSEVGRMAMDFVHGGIPMPRRKAVVEGTRFRVPRSAPAAPNPEPRTLNPAIAQQLLAALAHPNIASKHWIIRQYDHEVQGGSVIKPLLGPHQIGPSDAAVVRPKLGSCKGVAIACGLAPHIEDPYDMALAAIDEAIRNAVAVGADPERIAILDNFCWPSVDDERTMGALVRACEACRDAALAYRIPFISGKDSLHNQFTNQETGEVIRIPNTLLISAIGIIDDVRRCVTMDLKEPGNHLYLVQPRISTGAPSETLAARDAVHRAVAKAIRQQRLRSCHDISDGGVLVAIAEMCIAAQTGATVDLPALEDLFGEEPGRYVVELAGPARPDELAKVLFDAVDVRHVGAVGGEHLRLRGGPEMIEIDVEALTRAWRGTLDW